MIVRQRYATQTSALADFRVQRGHMLGEVRTGVDQPSRRSAYQP
jgi:hypothetical protein